MRERALIAPLVAALGGEVQGLSPREVLSDATKLAGGVRDLARSLGTDVATVEFGSRWDLEAAGAALDWSSFPPGVSGEAGAEPAGGRAGVLLDAIARVKAELGDRVVVAASVTGPALAAALVAGGAGADGTGVAVAGVGGAGGAVAGVGGAGGAGGDLAFAAKRALAAVRALCEAGAGLIWIVEDGARAPADAGDYARALTPVLGTARFYRADAALHLAGAADGWLDAVRKLRAAIPCFDPAEAPALAAEQRDFGVIVAPGARAPAHAMAAACALVTHDAELAGRVPARELRSAVQALKR